MAQNDGIKRQTVGYRVDEEIPKFITEEVKRANLRSNNSLAEEIFNLGIKAYKKGLKKG